MTTWDLASMYIRCSNPYERSARRSIGWVDPGQQRTSIHHNVHCRMSAIPNASSASSRLLLQYPAKHATQRLFLGDNPICGRRTCDTYLEEFRWSIEVSDPSEFVTSATLRQIYKYKLAQLQMSLFEDVRERGSSNDRIAITS